MLSYISKILILIVIFTFPTLVTSKDWALKPMMMLLELLVNIEYKTSTHNQIQLFQHLIFLKSSS